MVEHEVYEVVRDKKRITKTLILLEIVKGARKLKEIADAIGITIQGVSDYVREMVEEGLITKDMKITMEGVDFIEKSVKSMDSFLKEANKRLQMIRIVDAIAAEDIEEGDEVGLFMRKGRVMARKGEEDSMGIAINSARKGEDVGVTSLRGILKIDRGRIKICVLPSISEGGSRAVNYRKIENLIAEGFDIYAAYGSVAVVTLEKIGIDRFVEFAPAIMCVECALKGMNPLLLVSKDYLSHIIREITTYGYDVDYEIVSV